MRYIDLVQCSSCLEDLKDFKKLNVLTEREVDTLEAYTAFCEMRRLRKDKLSKVSINPYVGTPHPPFNPLTTIC